MVFDLHWIVIYLYIIRVILKDQSTGTTGTGMAEKQAELETVNNRQQK